MSPIKKAALADGFFWRMEICLTAFLQMFLYFAQCVAEFVDFAAQLVHAVAFVIFAVFVLVTFVAVFGFFTILARFAMAAFFVHLAGVGGQFLGPIAHSGGLQMLDGRADVFHSGFVAAFAFAVFTFPLAAFAVLVALGHFGFHVAKQFFGFFVFALFA